MQPRRLETFAIIGRNPLVAVLWAAALLGTTPRSALAHESLLVPSQGDHSVKVYDASTGAFVRSIGTDLGDPLDAVIGDDGNLLVTDGQQDAIRRFDWTTGEPLGTFATAVSPIGMTIAAGTVYVCQGNPPQIVRSFDASTGADTGSFTPTVGNGNPSPRDVAVANDRLYVAYWNLGTVEVFDLATRRSLGLLFPAGSGGLSTPSSLAFGPDGKLYVSFNTFVNRYHPTSGEFLGRFVDTGDRSGYRYAIGIAWGPDDNLYVATQNTPGVQRYDGVTGQFMDDFVSAGLGGLGAPFHIDFASISPSTSSTVPTTTTSSTTTTTLGPRCGDGYIDAGEQCDPGADDPGDCCSATCRLLTSGVCRAAPDGVSPNERGCYLPALCNGVDPFCPANELADGALCVDGDTCTPVDVCSGGHCVPGPAVCDVSVESELVVGQDATIPVSCGIPDGGRCRMRAFVAVDAVLRSATPGPGGAIVRCRRPVDGLCPITKVVAKRIARGATKVLRLKLSGFGQRLLARAQTQSLDLVATIQAKVRRHHDAGSPIRRNLVVRLRR